MAILSHTVTRKNLASQHSYCPTGPESWCAWQRDFASGTSTYDPKHCLPAVFLDLLKPIFTELSADSLLNRCVVGATQNQNKCINSLVWLRCPKHKFNAANIARYAASSAVIQFNGGSSMASRVMETLGTPIMYFRKKDVERVKLAKQASDKKEKKEPSWNSCAQPEKRLIRRLKVAFHMIQEPTKLLTHQVSCVLV